MYAVIRTGGKQYRVSEGDTIDVEKLGAEVGSEVRFDEVLLVGTDSDTKLGTPVVPGAAVTGKVVFNGRAPKVLLMAPPPVAKLSEFAEMFEGAEAKSRRLAEHYKRVADEHGCEFLDAAQVIVSSDIDGIHLDASEHQKLGEAVAARAREILASTYP